ncbi:MAG: hypothetical protein ACREMJ_09820 [Gemmatimonadales bacterium]
MTARGFCLAAVLACAAEQPDIRQAENPARFVVVTAGSAFTCALTAQGAGYCWGLNEQGQLGDGSPRRGSSAQPVAVAGRHTFTDISAGREHVCALTPPGQAYCWGHDPDGALGQGLARSLAPIPVATDLRFADVSAGDQRTCAVTGEGVVYCWGRFSRPSDEPAGRGGPEVVRVETPVRFRSVAAGLIHACGIGENGSLYCWGSNRDGALGIDVGVGSPRWVPPQRVPLTEPVTALSVSTVGTCAVTAGGAAYCWGRNQYGQLGNGRWTDHYAANATPTAVVGDQRWRVVSTAGAYTCGVTVEDRAYCWGANRARSPMLGTTAAPDRCDTLRTPVVPCSTRPVPVAGNVRFRHLVSGSHTCGIATDGVTYCWGGTNQYGQVGTGTTQPSAEPTPVVAPASGPQPGAVAPGRPPHPAPAGTLRMHPINPPAIAGPEPERRTGDATIMITLHGGVAEAVIADPQGRRLGFDPGAGKRYSEVSDAAYLSTGLGTVLPDGRIVDDEPWIEVYFNAPTDGEYTVVVIANKAGAYTLHIGGYDVRRRSSWFNSANVPITPGERHEYRFHFSAADAGDRGLDGRRVQLPNR